MRYNFNVYSSCEPTITDADYLPDNIEVMTPIIDGLRRLANDSEDTEEHESDIDTKRERHCSIDTTSTDTFQTNDCIDRSRKTSKTENNDLSSLRNLSTNGLMMFDPLVINAAASASNDANRLIPDQDLVTSLNEQVTEIADRLSSIAASDVDVFDQTHSYSTNDVPALISAQDEAFGFSGPRNEQLSCMPSTSHGYLIPNAISHEPAVLSSLSHNNSAVFNQNEEGNDITGAVLNNDLPLIIPDNIDAEIVNTNISIANANLSLILNDDVTDDNTSFHSAKMTLDREDDRVKFMLGYESDHESPVDSGVSTESTSLDRSPDTEQNKDVKENHYKQQNRVLTSIEDKNTIDSPFTDAVNINYVEEETRKNEASSSNIVDIRLNSEGELRENNVNNEAMRVLQEWGANATQEEYRTIDEVITELRRHRENDKKITSLVEENEGGPSQGGSRVKKSRKVVKSKRKKSKMWSPGVVILDNRSMQNPSPLRLNLDHFVDER